MKCIWFIYLKKFGYAFVDNPGSETTTSDPPTPSTPLARNLKRPRCSDDDDNADDGDDPLPNPPKRLRKSVDDEAAAVFDCFPTDSGLFDCRQDSEGENDVEGNDDVEESGDVKVEKLSGNQLFLSNRSRRQSKIKTFPIRYTIGMLYLALRYTNQQVLLPDLMR